ncbi:MAG: rRNA pseudouridine synthase [Synergistetes bacterium]|nr:MAG: Pseudouridine synthase family protein [bacterium 42_11]MBC7332340.1 rRNA pseudouridine synthase [Synergistota bacterium]MDK2870977.1 rRNA pseudouridine516 synthase [bacterium]
MSGMRIDRYLSLAKGLTRVEARKLIKFGKVSVNGRLVKDPGFKVEDGDEVLLDGLLVFSPRAVYIAMFKPPGFLSVTFGNEGSVLELLPHPLKKRLSIAGRLDKDVEGLLLLSDDGDFIHRVISPKRKVEKEYFVWIEGKLPRDAEALVERGLLLDDGMVCQPAKLVRLSDGLISLTIHEGKFHQVKRMCYSLGVIPTKIRRVRIGPVILGEAKPGWWRELTPEEVEILKGSLKV